jgi:hypothetical protein
MLFEYFLNVFSIIRGAGSMAQQWLEAVAKWTRFSRGAAG